MRNPKGLSGKSWLASAAADTPLARHFLDADLPYRSAENGKALFAAGELDAALPLIARASYVGDFLGALELALTDNAIPYSSGFVQPLILDLPDLAKSELVSIDDPRLPGIRNRLDLIPEIDRSGELLWGDDEGLSTSKAVSLSEAELRSIGNTLMGVPELRPINRIIEKHCPREAAEALAALQTAVYGHPLTHLTFSPVETILPTDDYRKSARFETDMLRRLWFSGSKVILQNLNDCAYSMVSRSSQ